MARKRRRRKNKNKGILWWIIFAVVVLTPTAAKYGPDTVKNISQTNSTSQKTTSFKNSPSFSDTYETIAHWQFASGMQAVKIVNHNQSQLKATDWKYSHIQYSNLDTHNRARVATAYLDNSNLGRSAGRPAQNWEPAGWHNQPITVNGKRVYPENRGHLIAYTLTFNLNSDGKQEKGAEGSSDNPKNLATQTAFSNQQPMQAYEEQVRTALEKREKVIYRVQPVYLGSELMPRGYWTQAISTNKKLNFNAYVWNVQPGVVFNYTTGRGKADKNMTVDWTN